MSDHPEGRSIKELIAIEFAPYVERAKARRRREAVLFTLGGLVAVSGLIALGWFGHALMT